MKKKIIAGCLMLVAAAAFAGCTGKGGDSDPDSTLEVTTSDNGGGEDEVTTEKKENPFSKIREEDLSSEYFIGAICGGAGMGTYYDCMDHEVIICKDKRLLIKMCDRVIGETTLTDEQYDNIVNTIDIQAFGYMVVNEDIDVCDGSSDFLVLYNKDNGVYMKKGGYMAYGKEYNLFFRAIMDNIPSDWVWEVRKNYQDELEKNENLIKTYIDETLPSTDFFSGWDVAEQLTMAGCGPIVSDSGEWEKDYDINEKWIFITDDKGQVFKIVVKIGGVFQRFELVEDADGITEMNGADDDIDGADDETVDGNADSIDNEE